MDPRALWKLIVALTENRSMDPLVERFGLVVVAWAVLLGLSGLIIWLLVCLAWSVWQEWQLSPYEQAEWRRKRRYRRGWRAWLP